jgi:uncharacterized protein YecE (DUF72 family)
MGDTPRVFRVGCSGWQYRHWRGSFYPEKLPLSRWFSHYASVFDTVEVNNSFYRLPEAGTFSRWEETSPPGFLFAVKASRYLTHMKKLKDPEEPVERFFERARELKRKLGPVLYQLPPRWAPDLHRFHAFLNALPDRQRHVVEFREPGWYSDEVYELLERHGVAMCLHDMKDSESPRRRVGPFVYVRFHGGGAKYGGRYGDEQVSEWADWLAEQTAGGTEVYAYFNNDWGGHAPRDALRLKEVLAAHAPSDEPPAR